MANLLIERTFKVGDAEVVVSEIPAAQTGDTVSVEADVMALVIKQVATTLASQGMVSGESFRYLRRALGIRAAEVAEILGVRPATVSDWETGKTRLDRAAWGLLADAVLRGPASLDPLRRRPQPGQTVRVPLTGGGSVAG
ncbi:MAG: helix-turn-helix transcriptional regulator [Myxococcota bacterium]